MTKHTVKARLQKELKRHLVSFDKWYSKEQIAFKKPAVRKMIDYSGTHLIRLADSKLQQIKKEDRERIKEMKRDTTPYSSNLTACCNVSEGEGEDGITYCTKCERLFPKLRNEILNEVIDDILYQLERGE